MICWKCVALTAAIFALVAVLFIWPPVGLAILFAGLAVGSAAIIYVACVEGRLL